MNISTKYIYCTESLQMGRAKRVWYLSPMRAAKVQASLRIRAVSPEPPLLAHTSRESRGTFRQKARSLPPLNGWACPVKICHDGMLEDTNSLDAAQIISFISSDFFGNLFGLRYYKFNTNKDPFAAVLLPRRLCDPPHDKTNTMACERRL